jgi:hypothetical protein
MRRQKSIAEKVGKSGNVVSGDVRCDRPRLVFGEQITTSWT